MPGQLQTPLHRSPVLLVLLMLLMLLMLSWLPSGGALSLAQDQLPALPGPSNVHSSLDISRFRELQKRYEDFLTRLRANQTWEDWNPDLITAPQVQILTPKLRLGPGGHLHLSIPRVDLTEGLLASSRLHRALLRLSPTARSSWDVTRSLQRQLSLEGSRAPVIRLRLLPRADHLLEALPSTQPQLELHWRSRAARGRRHANANTRDGCPLGRGRCCRLQSLRASVEDLGWADWVVAPRELDVRMCIGACPSHFRSANTHAQMQARLHGLNPDAAPAPCCVPASYEPVVLMHRDSEGSVSLTPFDDLVAKDCHCV
ncbi:growth/differentiation factor 15 [Camelus dromedarius]|uniref:growth/differentiation factor 15 n=1 Tax=Camelus dromedarius TaxID=9838 RepID=UPI00057BA01C|nr:growth/differentiation factor 15 [Camelus dromedarius]